MIYHIKQKHTKQFWCMTKLKIAQHSTKCCDIFLTILKHRKCGAYMNKYANKVYNTQIVNETHPVTVLTPPGAMLFQFKGAYLVFQSIFHHYHRKSSHIFVSLFALFGTCIASRDRMYYVGAKNRMKIYRKSIENQ